ncbi:flagellar transcriptional regulator FlhD [Salmonella enterica]|nr:flagellar transcriptional regulator FlhD [Salmonella enterica]EEH5466126.1 flagellar transcriptional regulator FlhD [Salmonella enterica]EEH7555570.1 flagellar transcriptional regulator FlhD [Salmonella enterica]EEO5639933.1 flagellar transcriptional regulator FlhD [Salmonella enterica]EEQ0203902.1 flagellar transcriptional regulator FlhD [Salmonella enterica]
MNIEQSLHEMNYTWLNLAQKMLLKDRSVAMFRLGLNARIADIISRMTETQLHQLSFHPHFIFTLRIQDPAALECLLQDSRVDHLRPMHAAILSLSDTGGGHGI